MCLPRRELWGGLLKQPPWGSPSWGSVALAEMPRLLGGTLLGGALPLQKCRVSSREHSSGERRPLGRITGEAGRRARYSLGFTLTTCTRWSPFTCTQMVFSVPDTASSYLRSAPRPVAHHFHKLVVRTIVDAHKIHSLNINHNKRLFVCQKLQFINQK